MKTLTILLLAAAVAHAEITVGPTATGDRTVDIQKALDNVQDQLLTGSANVRTGGSVKLLAGKYPLGGTGAVAHCAGGPNAGKTCTSDAGCGAATSPETREGYCAWLVIPRPTILHGEGIGTELVVTGKVGLQVHALAVSPDAMYSTVEGLHISSWPKKTGLGKGLVVLGRMVRVAQVTIDATGGDGLFADGTLGRFNVNNLHLEDIEISDAGADGVHVISGQATSPTAPLSGGGDASQMLFENVSAMSSTLAGFNLRSSKGTFASLKTNGNKVGFKTRGSHNVASIYAEIANQDPSVWFEVGSQGNLVFDSSQAAQTTGKYKNDGDPTNHWWSNGAMR